MMTKKEQREKIVTPIYICCINLLTSKYEVYLHLQLQEQERLKGIRNQRKIPCTP